MLLRLWDNMTRLENALADHNTYKMYSTIVTEGLNFAMVEPDDNNFSEQPVLDIEQVRILPMSHKYKSSAMHAGLMIYSVDGQTDFILNDAMLRVKTGDILIHQVHYALSGQDDIDIYRDLIRTLFGTHRINLIGLVFTFSGSGQFTNGMRWTPMSSQHTLPIHPTEQKLLEIVLVTLYMNNAWLSMPMAAHSDVETLSQSAKKQYLLKLGEIEQVFNKRRQPQEKSYYSALPNLLRMGHHSEDNFRSFEWTPSRQQTFDETVQRLLDELYNLIQQVFQDGEFDNDQYAYYDDSTKRLFSNLVNNSAQSQAYSVPPLSVYSAQPQAYSAPTLPVYSAQPQAYSAPTLPVYSAQPQPYSTQPPMYSARRNYFAQQQYQ
ncbi:unnamed protein product [Rotaria magnacalcarata]|uniref:Uncharacterized protein n=7 Tax=Rotaria magnacalcarata TaxID=392030 RepID=A0A816U480_9BILA|nr:unnamed protein product [Rotaria magnacalcarata]CAF2106243.1 unnamed protein product [Rotaria magnacalcarata]CAF2120406.1 unnamed protein product [Rotaria magnacalcarata]